MYRRKLIGFAVASASAVLVAAVMVVWSSRVTNNQINQVNTANALLAEHLQLSSTSYRLFKQLTDEILFGTLANQADVRNKRAIIAESLGRIRILEQQQRSALGTDFTRGSIEDTDDLESLIDSIITDFEETLLAPEAEPRGDQQVRFILEERIDIAFREAINTAVDRQSGVVAALNDRIDNIHLVIFWSSLLLALAATVLTLVGVARLVRAMSGPVDSLTRGAEAFAKGDLSHRVPRGFDAEFDEIAAAFNLMADQLAAQNVDREQARRELEFEVADRTAELTRANAALKKSDAVRRNFLADVSHELRTPLTIIRGEAQVALRQKDRNPEEYRDALSCVHEQSVSLSHLVDDLLFVARADANSLRIERQSVSLDALLPEIGRDLRGMADETGISLEVAVDDGTAIIADPDRIRQLLVILVENAISYSPPATTVRIGAGGTADAHVVLSVADQGHGIDAKDLPFVFERFYRGSRSDRRQAGMGLGLTVARAIAVAHDGEIEVESEVGQGTTFRVTLPAGGAA